MSLHKHRNHGNYDGREMEQNFMKSGIRERNKNYSVRLEMVTIDARSRALQINVVQRRITGQNGES